MLQRACPNMIQITWQIRICWKKVRKATPLQNALHVTLSLRTNWSLHVWSGLEVLGFPCELSARRIKGVGPGQNQYLGEINGDGQDDNCISGAENSKSRVWPSSCAWRCTSPVPYLLRLRQRCENVWDLHASSFIPFWSRNTNMLPPGPESWPVFLKPRHTAYQRIPTRNPDWPLNPEAAGEPSSFPASLRSVGTAQRGKNRAKCQSLPIWNCWVYQPTN